MNQYKPLKHITNEKSLQDWIDQKEWEKFLEILKPTPMESFETSINRIFKDALNKLNKIQL
jgi:hypothetical protein